jgi:hypothetical protein
MRGHDLPVRWFKIAKNKTIFALVTPCPCETLDFPPYRGKLFGNDKSRGGPRSDAPPPYPGFGRRERGGKDRGMTERMQEMPLGVVVERRRVDHPWQEYEWMPVAVIPGAGQTDMWKELARGDGWVRYHIGTLALELHRTETEAYKVNLSNDPPVIYVILSLAEDPDAEQEIEPFLVTASPYEAQDYQDADDDIIEVVPMPDGVIAWVQAFIDKHHVDEPFQKRKNKHYDPEKTGFGRRTNLSGQRPRGGGDA